LLGVVQGLVALLFASSKVLWDQTSYFTLPVSKVFLVLGGVFAPLADYAEPWRRILLALPPSDLFFQPASFCVTGSFHGMSPAQWVGRIGVQIAVLWVLNQAFHRHARKNHRGHGG